MTLPETVREIGQIHFEGNIIPHEWYAHIRLPGGKPDLAAITLLGEIVYWYRPVRVIDESTGKPAGGRKKFSGDLFQSSVRYYQEKFGLTKDQVKKGLGRLEAAGLIRREYRTVTRSGVTLANMMFVEPVAARIAEITFSGGGLAKANSRLFPKPESATPEPGGTTPEPGGSTPVPPGSTLEPGGSTPVPPGSTLEPGGSTYTKTSTEITTKTSTKISSERGGERATGKLVEPETAPKTESLSSPPEKTFFEKEEEIQPHPIATDWQPSAAAIRAVELTGIPEAFARQLVGEFVIYWRERRDQRAGWNASFIGHCKREWRYQNALAGAATPSQGDVGGKRKSTHNSTYGDDREENRQWGQRKLCPGELAALDEERCLRRLAGERAAGARTLDAERLDDPGAGSAMAADGGDLWASLDGEFWPGDE